MAIRGAQFVKDDGIGLSAERKHPAALMSLNVGYARRMPEGGGKFLIAPGAPPAECRERKAAGASAGLERGGG